MREVQKSLKESAKRLIEDKVRAFELGSLFIPREDRIITPGDGVIIFQGMQNHTQESIKSLEGFDIAWVEEARSLSQTSLDMLRPTIRKPGSELWFSWNPKLPSDPIDAFLRTDDPPPDSRVIEVQYRDNPWFPDELQAELEYDKRKDYEKYLHIWEGAYEQRSEARVFTNWREGKHEEFERLCLPGMTYRPGMVKVDRLFFGADWGFSVDPTVLVCACIVGRTLYILAEAWEVGCEIDHTPFLFGGTDDQQLIDMNIEAYQTLSNRQRTDYLGIPGSRIWPIVADSARPETISYMKKNGFPRMKRARKGAGSLEEGIKFLQSYEIVPHPDCRHTINELTFYRYKIDPLTDAVLPILEDKHNNTIDALRYSVEDLRLSVGRAGVLY